MCDSPQNAGNAKFRLVLTLRDKPAGAKWTMVWAIQAMKFAAPPSVCTCVHNLLKVCLLSTLIGGGMLLSGCGHKAATPGATTQPAADSTPAANNSTTAPQPAYTPPAATATAIAAVPTGGADLKQLNHYYISWIVQNHQRPKSFEEFVSLSGVQVPP